MSMLSLTYESKNGWMVKLCGKSVQFWRDYGLPTYEGPIEGLPADVVEELVKERIIAKN